MQNTAGREESLTGVHVGVLNAAVGQAGRALAVPVWDSNQPGGLLTVLTGRRSRKAAAIRAAGRFGLCVQDDSPPYRTLAGDRAAFWPARPASSGFPAQGPAARRAAPSGRADHACSGSVRKPVQVSGPAPPGT